MTCVSHRHRFAFVHVYKAGGTAVTDILLPHARMRERVAQHGHGRKLFYAVNIIQEKVSRGKVHAGTSSWYMGLKKHAPLSEVVAYLGRAQGYYRIFSVIREPFSWVESQYNYISMSPLHHQHKEVSGMSFVDYVQDFLDRRRGLQSHMLRPAVLAKGTRRGVDALFSLESLAEDTAPLRRYLGLDKADDPIAMPPRNQSRSRGRRDNLPEPMARRLRAYLASDVALHDAIRAAGGSLIAGPDDTIPRIDG